MAEELYPEFHESWHDLVDVYYKKINKALKVKGEIYPPRHQIFRVYKKPVEDIKLVILGQDPYHGPDQATGLCFSCDNGKGTLQPSLRNWFQELKTEFPERNYKLTSGDLSRWLDEEDIFLVNVALTVKKGEPGSNIELWRDFTNAVIQYISRYNDNCVFLLFGLPAKKVISHILDKDGNIDKKRIETCTHPSPLSAFKGFFGSNIFKKVEAKVGPINWETT